MAIVGVLLATEAGDGADPSRYLLSVRGTPVLGRAVTSAGSWPVDEVVVVLGPHADEIEERVDLGSVSVLVDPSWDEGLAAPMRAVLDLLSRDRSITHVVVGMADRPDIPAADVAALVDVAAESTADVVVPKYRYAAGFPVVLARSMWDVFLRLEGAIDIHDVIAAHAHTVEEVWFDHVAPRRIERATDVPESRR